MTRKKPKKHSGKAQKGRPIGVVVDVEADGRATVRVGADRLGKKASMAEAAAVTGLPYSLIQELKASVADSVGRIDCDKLLDLVASNPDLLSKHQAIPDLKVEKALDMRIGRMLKEQRYQERARELWQIEDVKRAWAEQIIGCKTKLFTAENSVSVEAGMRLGLKSDQIVTLKEILMKHIRSAIKDLHAGAWGKAACGHCGKEIASL